MSQFGMQMPGGRAKRSASMDVYAGLAFLAVAFLVTACVMVFLAAQKVGPDGNPFGQQQVGQIKLKAPAR